MSIAIPVQPVPADWKDHKKMYAKKAPIGVVTLNIDRKNWHSPRSTPPANKEVVRASAVGALGRSS